MMKISRKLKKSRLSKTVCQFKYYFYWDVFELKFNSNLFFICVQWYSYETGKFNTKLFIKTFIYYCAADRQQNKWCTKRRIWTSSVRTIFKGCAICDQINVQVDCNFIQIGRT